MSSHCIFLLISVIQWSTSHGELVCSYFDVVQNLSIETNTPGPEIRPVRNWRTPTTVNINLSLYTVVHLDTSFQTLTTYIWFIMEWQNEFLNWNPDDFCGIDKILIPTGNLWVPDLYIYEMIESDDKSPVIPYFFVYSDGTISDSRPVRVVSTCHLDIFKFPFDKQVCYLTFGPYIHAVKDILMFAKLNSSQVYINSLEIFVSKGDWTLLDISVTNTTTWSEGVEYSQVIYKMSIQRAPVVYIINLIIPACFLVLLDIASMFIQMGTGERLVFKITVVLGFSVLLLILNNMLPTSDNPPVLGIFCCVCLAIMVLSIIGSIATSYMLTLSESQPNVPAWIKIWIMRRLARVLCFKVLLSKQDEISIGGVGKEGNNDGKKAEISRDHRDRKGLQKNSKTYLEVKILKRLLAEILQIHQDLTLSKNMDDAKSEWYIAAMIVDRLVLIIYLIIVIVMLAVVISVWVT